jgi:hypothetical protein
MKASIVVSALVLICGSVNAQEASSVRLRRLPRDVHRARLVHARHHINPTTASGPDLSAAVKTEEADEQRFQTAMEKAKAEPRLQELKAKADNALSDEEARKTAVAYNRALFRRIREIDSSVTDRANAIEEAILRRVAE